MVVHLIAEARIASLIEALELVEAHGKSVRHEEAVEENGKTRLAESLDFFCLAQNLRACRNQQVLAVMGKHIVG